MFFSLVQAPLDVTKSVFYLEKILNLLNFEGNKLALNI